MQIRARWRPGKRTLIGGAAATALVAAFVLALVPDLRRDADRSAKEEKARQAERVAAELRRLGPAARAHTARVARSAGADQRPLEYRRDLVREAQSLVTADARVRVRAREIKGPVAGTVCSPYPETAARGALERKPEAVARLYECVAYRYRFKLPELQGRSRTGVLGTPFRVVIHDRRSKVTWCKVSPPPGEGGGSPLARVAVPAVCQRPAPRS